MFHEAPVLSMPEPHPAPSNQGGVSFGNSLPTILEFLINLGPKQVQEPQYSVPQTLSNETATAA